MSDFLDALLERPTWQKVAIWVGSIALVLFIFWQYFYKVKSGELTTLTEEVETLKTQINNEKRIARDLPKVKAEVKDLDAKLSYALQELPDRKEIPDLLSTISDKARDAGLEIILFKPKGENIREFYAEVPVAISVVGSYHQVAAFFDDVGHLDRIVNISQIGAKEPKVVDEGTVIRTDCLATTFRYLDEAERSSTAQEKVGKRKKRGVKTSSSSSKTDVE